MSKQVYSVIIQGNSALLYHFDYITKPDEGDQNTFRIAIPYYGEKIPKILGKLPNSFVEVLRKVDWSDQAIISLNNCIFEKWEGLKRIDIHTGMVINV